MKLTQNEIMRKTLGDNLRLYREAANIPPKIFAERIHLTNNELDKLERGKSETINNFPLLVKITEELNIRLEDLFEYNNEYIRKYHFNEYFYDYFEQVMKTKNISKNFLCDKLEITVKDYWYYRNGKKIFPVNIMQNLLVILKINSYDLKTYQDNYFKENPQALKKTKTRKIKTPVMTGLLHSANATPTKPMIEHKINTEEKKEEPLNEIIKAYNFYKNVKAYIQELDNIIQTAQKMKQQLEKSI